jgi:transglutaminase-like putative cysteine protease
MKGQRHLGLVAAAATLLASAPMSAIFDRWTWLLQSAVLVALVAAAAALARWLLAPVWAQVLAMLAALLLGLTWLFPSGEEFASVLPTLDTFAHFGELAQGSVSDMREYGVPVPDTATLLFITVLGVGAVAVVVDLLTVGLRRPALAGLPMLAIYSVPVAVYVDSVPAVPFAVGAVGFLWLLVADNVERVRGFGRRFTGDGRDVDVWEPSPLAAAGRRLSVVGVVLAVSLPVAVPGMTSGLLNSFTTAAGTGPGQGGVGGPSRVNLFASLSGQLNQSQVTELARVSTDDPAPGYLRFGVADDLRTDGFRVRSPRGQSLRNGLPTPPDGPGGVTRTRHRAQIEVSDNFAMPLLPTYGDPVAIRGLDASWSYDPDQQVVYSGRSQARGRTVTVDYVRSDYDPAALARAASLPADNPLRQPLTRVPDQVVEVDQLVNRLTRNARSDYAKVRAIYEYFSASNGFRYSLSTPGGTSGKDILDFLTGRTGFCQQYASAMAWLVRVAGVPSRVAFGFTNGTERRDGKTVLTNHNLHAWTEVYFNGFGWVPFDATPAASVPGSVRSEWAPDTDAPAPVVPSAGPTDGPGPSAAPGIDDDLARDKDANLVLPGQGPAVAPAAPTWPWWTLAGVLLGLGLLAVPALLRVAVRRRRQTGAVPAPEVAQATPDAAGAPPVVLAATDTDRARLDAHAAWDELLDTMVDLRLPVDPAETPRATADRLVTGGLPDSAAAGVKLLSRAEERARYSRRPTGDSGLGEALRSARQGLAGGVSRRTRLVAVVLPPSVLIRWRTRVLDGFSGAVAVVGRGRDAVLRFSPRRLLAGRAGR